MYDENGFVREEQAEVFTECKVVEPQDHKKKRGQKKKFAKAAAVVLCAALLAGGGFAVGNYTAKPALAENSDQDLPSKENENNIKTPEVQAMGNLLSVNNQNSGKMLYTPKQIAEKYLSSIVAITSKSIVESYNPFVGKQQYENSGAGSGIIVAKTEKELIIATNNHVVEGTSELTVCLNDNEEQIYSAYIKGTDPSNDLAVVGVKIADIPKNVLDSLAVAVLGNSDECAIGEQVVAIGNALGYGQSLTSGYISALDRVVTVDNVTYTLIQTDAAINPGNSGGALFNMYGEVIGINSVKFASSNVEGMGFAIPISKAMSILNNLAEREPRELVDEEDQGFLEITGSDVTASSASSYNMPVGVHVRSVEEGSGSEKAGMLAGDIITAFDGLPVSGMTQLKSNLQYYRKGETVKITVKRLTNGNYEEVILDVTLGERPEEEETDNNLGNNQQQESDSNGYGNWFDDLFGFPGR